MKIEIIPTMNSEHLAKDLEKNPNFHVNYIQKNKDGKRLFPDGEIYMRINGVTGRKIVVLYSGAPNTNDSLVELEFVLTYLKDNKLGPVELFITYFPYSRQDKVFEKGEINVAESLIKKWTKAYGVKKIYVVDPHFSGRAWLKKYPVVEACAYKVLVKTVRLKYPEVVFITPDMGSCRRTKIGGVSKKRKDSYNVEVSYDDKFKQTVNKKIVGVVDDMIGTGGTMVRINEKCKELGASKLIAIATHGVLESGIIKVAKTYDELFLANTINCKNANVNILNLITEAIITKMENNH
jgi:ribose-phosphate pyrophosphokinase